MTNKNLDIASKIINGKNKMVKHTFESVGETLEFTLFDQGDLEELQEIQNEGEKASVDVETKESGSSKDKVKNRVKRKQKTRDQVQKFKKEIDMGRLGSKNNAVIYRSIEISTGIPEDQQKQFPPFFIRELMEYIVKINELTEDDLQIAVQFREDE